MWIYAQSTGQLWSPSGVKFDTGYSGDGEGQNNPAMEHVENVGPIPRGDYVIGAPYDWGEVGPYALPLTPHLHDAQGRTALCAHGENKAPPYGDSSKGCPIFKRSTRVAMGRSMDKLLRVIE